MGPKWSWSTLPWQAAVAFVLFIAFMVALLPQLVAVAVTSPGRFVDDRLRLAEVFALWGKVDPTSVTGAATSGVVHWALVSLVLLAMVGATVAGLVVYRRHQKDPQRKRGLATVTDALKELGTVQLVKKRGPKLRPSVPPSKLRPVDCGYRVGTFWGHELWLRVEDPTIVIGPSRSGKGLYLALNWILSAPGAVITTTSKMDNVKATLLERERQGSRSWVFAPGVSGGEDLGHVLRWDAVDGCVDEETLVRRIKALIPSDSFSGSTSNGGHWDTIGQQLAAHLFHGAACAGVGVDRIWDWVTSPQRAMEAVRAIREHPDGLAEHAAHLETTINMPPEQRATHWGVLPTVLAFLESRSARKWMTPTPKTACDLVDFVLRRQTLYLVGDKKVSGGYVRILDGLLAELDHITKGLADASPGERLDPPVTYILDEAGNFEYQGLYELITAGGGRGRVAVAVFQSKEQLNQWGTEEGKTMWDAAPAKIILPGGADEGELASLSRLIGELWVHRQSHSWGQGPASIQVSEEKRAILEPSELREMEAGYGLLFYRNLKPVIPKLRPFTENAAYARCEKDQQTLSRQMQASSPYSARLEAARRGA